MLDVGLRRLCSRDDLAALRPYAAPRLAYEQLLSDLHRDDASWTQPGFCLACRRATLLEADWSSSVGSVVNYRERLRCERCRLNNRQRFIAGLVRQRAGIRGSIYLYEQVTEFYAWADRAFPGRVTGSEYLGPAYAGGATVNGLRHEDAMAFSFADASFDVLVSQDVFEHVPEIAPTFDEAARVLRRDGWLYFSIPFWADRDETVRRARLEDGEVVALLPAQYHGNPIHPEGGSLVFWDHGWSILDALRGAGFADAHVLAYWSARHGHIGDGMQLAFAAQRG